MRSDYCAQVLALAHEGTPHQTKPGFWGRSTTSVVDNRPLAGFPVYLRIGGADQLGWADRFEETVEALTEAGVALNAAILDSAPHMFRMNWDSLDTWLQEVVQ